MGDINNCINNPQKCHTDSTENAEIFGHKSHKLHKLYLGIADCVRWGFVRFVVVKIRSIEGKLTEEAVEEADRMSS